MQAHYFLRLRTKAISNPLSKTKNESIFKQNINFITKNLISIIFQSTAKMGDSAPPKS